MRLRDIAAVPHPDGNRIDVSWTLPATPPFPLDMAMMLPRLGYVTGVGAGTAARFDPGSDSEQWRDASATPPTNCGLGRLCA